MEHTLHRSRGGETPAALCCRSSGLWGKPRRGFAGCTRDETIKPPAHSSLRTPPSNLGSSGDDSLFFHVVVSAPFGGVTQWGMDVCRTLRPVEKGARCTAGATPGASMHRRCSWNCSAFIPLHRGTRVSLGVSRGAAFIPVLIFDCSLRLVYRRACVVGWLIGLRRGQSRPRLFGVPSLALRGGERGASPTPFLNAPLLAECACGCSGRGVVGGGGRIAKRGRGPLALQRPSRPRPWCRSYPCLLPVTTGRIPLRHGVGPEQDSIILAQATRRARGTAPVS